MGTRMILRKGTGGGGGGSSAISDAAYKEGYGKNATGGAGQTVYTVTSSAATGAGTFHDIFSENIQGSFGIHNAIIQFAVAEFAAVGRHALGSNVTIDGTLNGQNGVTYDQSLSGEGSKNSIVVFDPADNIIIRGINFRGLGRSSVQVATTLNGASTLGGTSLVLTSAANLNDPADWTHSLVARISGIYSGSTTNGSPIVTGISSTTNIKAGMIVRGSGINDFAILTIDSGTQITLASNATVSGSTSLYIFNDISYSGINYGTNTLTGVSNLKVWPSGSTAVQLTEAEDDHIWLCSTQGGTISNVLIDRCTFYQPQNKAFAMTRADNGIKRNITLQRCLFSDPAYNSLIKFSGPDYYTGVGILASQAVAGATSMVLNDASGFIAPGIGVPYASTDVFTFTSKGGTGNNTLLGIPASGANAIGTTLNAGDTVIQHGLSKLNGALSAGATSVVLVDATNFPTSGAAWIAGEDRFTWTNKSGNTLTGVPSSGDNAVAAWSGTQSVVYEKSSTYMLRNYAISLHHNAYIRGGERLIGQIKDQIGLPTGHAIDPTNAGPFEMVNNVGFQSITSPVAGYYVTNFTDGSPNAPYAVRFWCTDSTAQQFGTGRAGAQDTGDQTNGSLTVNCRDNYFIGDRATMEIRTDGGADNSRLYLAGNTWTESVCHPDNNNYTSVCNGANNCQPEVPGTGVITQPWHSENAVAAGFEITALITPANMAAQMLPYVGAPNRTAKDTLRLAELAAQLP